MVIPLHKRSSSFDDSLPEDSSRRIRFRPTQLLEPILTASAVQEDEKEEEEENEDVRTDDNTPTKVSVFEESNKADVGVGAILPRS